MKGNNTYSYRSTICSSAVHSGAVEKHTGGFFYIEIVEDYFDNAELVGAERNGIISQPARLRDLVPVFGSEKIDVYGKVFRIGKKDETVPFPRYVLNNTGTHFDGEYHPDNCLNGRFRLRKVASGADELIRFTKSGRWILYQYSDNLSGCDERNINSCPRIYAWHPAQTINPPNSTEWRLSDNGIPGV